MKGEIISKQNDTSLYEQGISKHIFNIALCFSTEQWWESYSSFLFFGMEFIFDESAYYQGFIEVLDGMQGNSDRI